VVVKADDNNPYFITDRLLKRGSYGESVKWLQFQLVALNGAILNIDGVFGEQTEKAVIKYQEAKGLEVDGIAGEQTIKSLVG
jgi:peptidoglycan hydrolase-like protein with peptidoglycan-binding domain